MPSIVTEAQFQTSGAGADLLAQLQQGQGTVRRTQREFTGSIDDAPSRADSVQVAHLDSGRDRFEPLE